MISGTGGFTQNGAGSTILNNVESYTGPTNVIQGTLIVAGSTAKSSLVTVGSGGTLEAPGVINGNVTSSGTLTSISTSEERSRSRVAPGQAAERSRER